VAYLRRQEAPTTGENHPRPLGKVGCCWQLVECLTSASGYLYEGLWPVAHVISDKRKYLPLFEDLGPGRDEGTDGEAMVVVEDEHQQCRTMVDGWLWLCWSGRSDLSNMPGHRWQRR